VAPASRDAVPVFRSAFNGPEDEYDTNLGVRPVVFDILAPDRETSLLPEGLKLVLHVNPSSMKFSYEKAIERIQTKGGYVEQHWGEGARTITFDIATGGFKRLYSGLSNVTGGGFDTGGTRRETIAYDKYLDMLALFHNNGSIYDTRGQIVFQGIIKVTFDGGIYFGWFTSFNVNEAAEKPFQFDLSASFTVSHEVLRLRSYITPEPNFVQDPTAQTGSLPTPTSTPQQQLTVQQAIRGDSGDDLPDIAEPQPPTVVPVQASESAVPKEPTQAIDPTLSDERGPTVLWSGASGEVDEGLRPFNPSDYEGTTPGWRTVFGEGEEGVLEIDISPGEGTA
jgi:hypothetical protein